MTSEAHKPTSGKERLAAAMAAKGVAVPTSSDLAPQAGTSREKLRQAARRGRAGPVNRGGPGVLRADGAQAFLEGDCLSLMGGAEDCSVDLIFTDPGIGGDGPGFERGAPGQPYWDQMFRVAKPGAHLAVFSSRKYSHRVVVRAEDAGFEMRDTLLWLYPKGMPMAIDVGQAVDKRLGGDGRPYFRTVGAGGSFDKSNPWYGWGTELRPTWEPISILRKPPEGSVADNVLSWGTGAMNIDRCRIEGEERDAIATYIPEGQGDAHGLALTKYQQVVGKTSLGRWPGDALFNHDEDCGERGCVVSCAVACLEREFEGTAKYFYCPKASRAEKDLGLSSKENKARGVKPIAVCRWVIDLLLPPNGLLLDPFCGTGNIGLGGIRLDGTPSPGSQEFDRTALRSFRFVGMDVDPHVLVQAQARWDAYLRSVTAM